MIWVLWFVVIVFAAIGVWMFVIEPNWFWLRRVRIPGKSKLKNALTILHLSDIHFTAKMGLKHYFFQRLWMLNPDLVVVTGDVIENNDGIETAKKYLSGIRARYGTYVVLGNHDYFDYWLKDNIRYYVGGKREALLRNDTKRLVEAMRSIGVRVLINESTRLVIRETPVWIGGTGDPVTRKIDLKKTIAGMNPEAFNILLTHQLDGVMKDLPVSTDLVFSGHTHGGQIRIPFYGSLFCDTRLPRKYIDGFHEYNGSRLIISRGLGSGRHLWMRLACRPEAIFVEVTP